MTAGIPKVVVCGSGYGRSYADALSKDAEFHLSGIVGRGSARSIALAQSFNVGAYDRIDDLPDDIAIACVAVGGTDGADLADALLQSGRNVLLEHPVEPERLRRLHHTAERHGNHILVNFHAGDLQAPKRFTELYSILHGSLGAPRLITCTATLRTMHGLCDILVRCGLTSRVEVGRALRRWPASFTHCVAATIDGVPLMVTLWEPEPSDRGAEGSTAHRIAATFSTQTLLLANTWGPVLELRALVDALASNVEPWRSAAEVAPSPQACVAQRERANLAAIRRLSTLMRLSSDRRHQSEQLAAADLAFDLIQALRSEPH